MLNQKIYLAFILLITLSVSGKLSAQEEVEEEIEQSDDPELVDEKEIDTTAFISYTDKMQIRLHLDSHLEDYYVTANDDELNLALNNDLRLSFVFDYRIFSFSYSFTPDFLPGNHDDDDKGESEYSDFTAKMFPGQFVQELTYQRMKGFYVRNPEDFIQDFENDANIVFPDLKRTHFGGSTAYVINPKFSVESLVYQRQWQKYSTGSFIPRFNYSYTGFKNKFEDFRAKEKNYDLSLDLGYHYNWVITQNLNFSPSVFGGLGTRFENYTQRGENINIKENNTYFTQQYGAAAQLGFNTDKFLMGVSLSFKSFNYENSNNTQIRDNSWFGLFFVGYRLDPPKKLKEIADKF